MTVSAKQTPEKMFDAAQQFEALLISQLLKSMREAGSGSWLGTGEDSSAASAMEMAEEQFARTIAAQGGLGLARMVSQGMEQAGSS
jgi:flagellar protein FlgJ